MLATDGRPIRNRCHKLLNNIPANGANEYDRSFFSFSLFIRFVVDFCFSCAQSARFVLYGHLIANDKMGRNLSKIVNINLCVVRGCAQLYTQLSSPTRHGNQFIATTMASYTFSKPTMTCRCRVSGVIANDCRKNVRRSATVWTETYFLCENECSSICVEPIFSQTIFSEYRVLAFVERANNFFFVCVGVSGTVAFVTFRQMEDT